MRRSAQSGWKGRVVTAYRPDPVVDPEFDGFRDNVAQFGALTGEDTATWSGYLAAHRKRRAFFKSMGATSTDHGHPTARTRDLTRPSASACSIARSPARITADDAEAFRGQMLTEMARMSLDDGLVMQIHPGSFRNHNPRVFRRLSAATRAPTCRRRTDYVHALKPLLDRFGNERELTIILFTLDETSYARELAPLAGHYPVLKLGPPWWFYDSPEGMLRFREQDDRDRGLLQHRRLQRRHARVPVDPGAPRRRAAHGLPLPRDARARAQDRRGRGVRTGAGAGARSGQGRIQALAV